MSDKTNKIDNFSFAVQKMHNKKEATSTCALKRPIKGELPAAPELPLFKRI